MKLKVTLQNAFSSCNTFAEPLPAVCILILFTFEMLTVFPCGVFVRVLILVPVGFFFFVVARFGGQTSRKRYTFFPAKVDTGIATGTRKAEHDDLKHFILKQSALLFCA